MTREHEPEPRHEPSVARVYANEEIEVTWEPGYCIHFAACIRASPGAFDPQRRPWVDLEADTAERLIEAIAQCPTGALHARRRDGGPAVEPDAPTEVQPRRNGPLFMRGPVRIVDGRGALVREDTRVALCRCGDSANKPFCDGSHRTNGFKG